MAELPARDTTLVGMTVRATRLREHSGISVVGLWQRGRLRPAYPDTVIAADSVLVLVGPSGSMERLAAPQPEGAAGPALALVIGAGKVGRAAARALRRSGLAVHLLDRDAAALAGIAGDVDATIVGDAADRDVLDRAGIHQARTVLLTTNDDAMNIYLAVFCRRLNAGIRIVSRITHERNVEAIHRAGADFVLSYTSLGVDAVMSLLDGHEPIVLGEGVRLFSVPVPASLAGRTLGESGIGSRTGLSVVALEHDGAVTAPLSSETVLSAGAELIMLGSLEQRHAFAEAYEDR
ncbi:MAG TPA: NAD-binding protein [Vicinamibacterales bacterium]